MKRFDDADVPVYICQLSASVLPTVSCSKTQPRSRRTVRPIQQVEKRPEQDPKTQLRPV